MAKRGYKARPVAERFWEKVNKDGPVPPHCPELGPCWIWAAGINHHRGGYGMFALRKGVIRRSHRIAWELTNGPIPDGLHACHRCDNPPCVRPGHLFLGTDAQNIADMVSKGRDIRPSGDDNKVTKLSNADVAAIREARAEGVKGKDLAAQYGVHITTIYHASRDTRLYVGGALRHVPARGEAAGGAILTEEKVRWIRAQVAGGRTCAEIGRELGMERGPVWRAATGRSWKHV
jgi:hypothetical protein